MGGGVNVARTSEDPEMIVKTLSSKIRKGFAEGVSRGHQRCVTVIPKMGKVVERGGAVSGPCKRCKFATYVQFWKTSALRDFTWCWHEGAFAVQHVGGCFVLLK